MKKAIHYLPIFTVVTILFFSQTASADKLYEWLDNKGGLHLTDTPPPPKKAKKILRTYQTTPKSKVSQTEATPAPVPPTPLPAEAPQAAPTPAPETAPEPAPETAPTPEAPAPEKPAPAPEKPAPAPEVTPVP